MRKISKFSWISLIALAIAWPVAAETPADSLSSFDVFSHDPGVLADRSWGPVEAGGSLPWQEDTKSLYYLKPSGTISAALAPAALAEAFKEVKVPGLDWTGEADIDDQKLAALLKPLLPAPHLRVLKLEGTHVSDRSIALINQLTNLEVLTLSASISDAGLSNLHLARLRELKIGNGSVTNQGMKALARLTSLRRLDMAESAVTPQGFQALSSLRLDQLRLGPAFNDQAMEQVSRIRSLGQLDLSQTRVTDKGLARLAALPVLHTLFLPKGITDTGMASLQKLQRLRRLDLSQSGVTDAGIRYVAVLKNLEELALGGTSITDASVAPLQGLAKLRILDVTSTRLTRAGIEQLNALKKLQVLAMSSEKSMQFRDLKALNGLKGLRTLVINGRPASLAVLAYVKATGISGGDTALGFSGGKPAVPEDTPVEALPTEKLQNRRKPMQLAGLYQIHEMESELDHVIPAVETASIQIHQDTEANFLGEIEVGVASGHKSKVR